MSHTNFIILIIAVIITATILHYKLGNVFIQKKTWLQSNNIFVVKCTLSPNNKVQLTRHYPWQVQTTCQLFSLQTRASCISPAMWSPPQWMLHQPWVDPVSAEGYFIQQKPKRWEAWWHDWEIQHKEVSYSEKLERHGQETETNRRDMAKRLRQTGLAA